MHTYTCMCMLFHPPGLKAATPESRELVATRDPRLSLEFLQRYVSMSKAYRPGWELDHVRLIQVARPVLSEVVREKKERCTLTISLDRSSFYKSEKYTYIFSKVSDP